MEKINENTHFPCVFIWELGDILSDTEANGNYKVPRSDPCGIPLAQNRCYHSVLPQSFATKVVELNQSAEIDKPLLSPPEEVACGPSLSFYSSWKDRCSLLETWCGDRFRDELFRSSGREKLNLKRNQNLVFPLCLLVILSISLVQKISSVSLVAFCLIEVAAAI